MKKLTKKAIEAGFVPPNALEQAKQWGVVDDDVEEQIPENATPEDAKRVVGEVKELIDQSDEIPEVRETLLDADKMFQLRGKMARMLADTRPDPVEYEVATMRDSYGNFLIAHTGPASEIIAKRGTRILWREGELDVEFDVVEVRPTYMGDKINYYVCAVQPVPDHAKMF